MNYYCIVNIIYNQDIKSEHLSMQTTGSGPIPTVKYCVFGSWIWKYLAGGGWWHCKACQLPGHFSSKLIRKFRLGSTRKWLWDTNKCFAMTISVSDFWGLLKKTVFSPHVTIYKYKGYWNAQHEVFITLLVQEETSHLSWRRCTWFRSSVLGNNCTIETNFVTKR